MLLAASLPTHHVLHFSPLQHPTFVHPARQLDAALLLIYMGKHVAQNKRHFASKKLLGIWLFNGDIVGYETRAQQGLGREGIVNG